MGMIEYGNVALWNTDLEVFRIIKVRDNWNCSKCGKSINKKSYCWGGGYQKYCITCGLIVCNNATEKINELLMMIKNTKQDVEKNYDKYITENLVDNL